ncbi:DUF257 domain-containing protein [Thermococcus aggregans]|uniref:DUF257 domain-containing protein n=1 Tax=Thermococcus aggregans TaxID=110163 RepID=A0A9E7SPJ4_THEAG|nr:DUF257 family protein [Thermococcus aggregans]USS41678.1 DUF257 domain-containing protein [Thermococcus aggregans]
MKDNSHRIWDSLKWGETVLIEYDSVTSPALLFYSLINWAREKGHEIVVDDILDSFYLYKRHLELAGLDTSILGNITVIKIGGRLSVGQVIGRIGIKEPTVQSSEYKKIVDSLSAETIINPILGFEKLLFMSESKEEVLSMTNTILSFSESARTALYFVNVNLIKETTSGALPLLEEIATTVIRMHKRERKTFFNVVKSVNNEIDGVEVEI